MNPNANPFYGKSYPPPKKPIDVANNEIRNLKTIIIDLRKQLEFINSQVIPLMEDYEKRKRKLDNEAKEEAEYEKIVKNSWW